MLLNPLQDSPGLFQTFRTLAALFQPRCLLKDERILRLSNEQLRIDKNSCSF